MILYQVEFKTLKNPPTRIASFPLCKGGFIFTIQHYTNERNLILAKKGA